MSNGPGSVGTGGAAATGRAGASDGGAAKHPAPLVSEELSRSVRGTRHTCTVPECRVPLVRGNGLSHYNNQHAGVRLSRTQAEAIHVEQCALCGATRGAKTPHDDCPRARKSKPKPTARERARARRDVEDDARSAVSAASSAPSSQASVSPSNLSSASIHNTPPPPATPIRATSAIVAGLSFASALGRVTPPRYPRIPSLSASSAASPSLSASSSPSRSLPASPTAAAAAAPAGPSLDAKHAPGAAASLASSLAGPHRPAPPLVDAKLMFGGDGSCGSKHRKVPHHLHTVFLHAVVPHFRAYLSTHADSHNAGVSEKLSRILDLPSQLLPRTSVTVMGSARNRHHALGQQIASRATSLVAVENDELVPPKPRNDDPNAAKVKKAVGMIKTGFPLTKAAQSLLQQPAIDVTESSIAKMRELHPQASGAIPPKPDPIASDPPHQLMPADDIAKLIRGCNKMVSPGHSGWTRELMLPLLSDSTCVQAIGAMILDICRGRFKGTAVANRLKASRLFAIPNEPKVRPIACGEFFLKIATKSLVTPALLSSREEMFPEIQFGVGVPGGAEVATHETQFAIESDANCASLKIDFRNAFNAVSRAAVARAFYANNATKRLHSLFDFVYGSPAPLLMYHRNGTLAARLLSEEGVRQGDVLGSLAFALTVQPVFVAAAEHKECISAVAYLDDNTTTGSIDAIGHAIERITTLAPDIGLDLNLNKSNILWPHRSSPPIALTELARKAGIPVIHGQCGMLGARVGTNTDTMSERIAEQTENEHADFFDALRHPAMDKQCAMLLLRVCGLPRFCYLARAVAPSVSNAACVKFDKLVSKSFGSIIGRKSVPFQPSTTLTIESPLSLGGIGLVPRVAIASAAYLAALSSACRFIREPLLQYVSTDGACLSHRAIQSALDAVRANGSTIIAATNPSDFFAEFRSQVTEQQIAHAAHLQRSIMREIHEFRIKNAVLSPQDRARLTSAMQANAYAWLTTPPTDGDTTITNPDFTYALRHRAGVSPFDHPFSCPGCGVAVSDTNHDHLFACPTIRSVTCIPRHKSVLNALHRIGEASGAYTQIEYRPPRQHGSVPKRIRPDVSMVGSDLALLSDVAIVTPTAKSYVAKSSKTALAAAKIVGDRKSAKYRALAAAEHKSFLPFVVESYGAMGSAANTLIDQLDQHHKNTESDSDWSLKKWANRIISVSIQRGNGRGVAAAIRADRRPRSAALGV